MARQIRFFLLTLACLIFCPAVMYVLADRSGMAMATVMGGVVGPFAGLFWTHYLLAGLTVLCLGLGLVIAVIAAGWLSKQAGIRAGSAVVAAFLWFGFGAYGIFMLA